MQFEALDLDGVWLFKPRRFEDDRGYFMETFRDKQFQEITGSDLAFVQDNQSLSVNAGTVRGLHFQTPPHPQGKLVRCVAGHLLDVAVDARKGSSTYGQHISAELSADNGHQLWVPPGFLHGFSTLEDNTIIAYKCTDYYAAECDGSVLWNDSDLGIDWKIDDFEPSISGKDAAAQRFVEFDSPF